MNITALLFDMDGLMLDTERLNLWAWQQAMADLGYDAPERLYLQTVGLTDADTNRVWLDELGDAAIVTTLRAREMQHLTDHIARHGPPLKPGLLALLDRLDELALPRAVASSRGQASIRQWLAQAGLLPRLHALVGGDEVARGKPAPDLFLAAARRLNVAPAGCLVLEDSTAGIRAAHAAGMIPVMVPDLIPPTAEIRALAHAVVADLYAVGDLLKL